jgi:hypothetical protein
MEKNSKKKKYDPNTVLNMHKIDKVNMYYYYIKL